MLCGAMFGLNSVGFSMVPGVIKTIHFSKFHQVMASPFTLLSPVALAFVALEGYDVYNFFSPIPLSLGIGFLVTLSY